MNIAPRGPTYDSSDLVLSSFKVACGRRIVWSLFQEINAPIAGGILASPLIGDRHGEPFEGLHERPPLVRATVATSLTLFLIFLRSSSLISALRWVWLIS